MQPVAFAAALVVLLAPAAMAKVARPPALAHAAQACSDTGAFGRHFGEAGYGHIDTTVDDEWAPFAKLTITTHRISAVAAFQDKQGADAFELAHRFLKAFDKAVKDSGKFPHRQAHADGVAFRSGDDGGLEFDLRQEGDRVVADCSESGL